MKIPARSTLAIISVILFLNALAATEAKAQVLNEILRRIDVHQKSLSSLRSKMAMEKYNSQLNESDLFQGTTIYTRLAKKQVFTRIDWTKPMSESLDTIARRVAALEAAVGHRIEKKHDTPQKTVADELQEAFDKWRQQEDPAFREFYQQYRQYILSDGLMYVVFVVVLGLLFLFFG